MSTKPISFSEAVKMTADERNRIAVEKQRRQQIVADKLIEQRIKSNLNEGEFYLDHSDWWGGLDGDVDDELVRLVKEKFPGFTVYRRFREFSNQYKDGRRECLYVSWNNNVDIEIESVDRVPAPAPEQPPAKKQKLLDNSDAAKIYEFARESWLPERLIPSRPPTAPLSMDRLKWLFGMVQSEMVEIAQVFEPDPAKAIELVKGCIGIDVKPVEDPPLTDQERLCEQIDGLVDMLIYLYDFGAKEGINLSRFLSIVHESNMKKRFPDGTFHKDDKWKVLKPKQHGWQEPDLDAELIRQQHHGAFSG